MMRNIFVLFLALVVSGCSSIFGNDSVFRDRRSDYLLAEEVPAMSVPADLDTETLGVLYPVPDAGQVSDYELGQEFETPRPSALEVDQTDGQVRIQRLGGEQWILVPAPPSETWPLVRGYLTESRIPAVRTNAEEGTIETGLISYDDSSVQHQFRFRLEQGVRLNTTEIAIDHRQVDAEAQLDELPAWSEEQSDDTERVDDMRLAMAEALASDSGTGTASLLGQRIGAAAKVEVVTPSAADPYILMHLNFERSWASVQFALDTEAFSLQDSSESEGEFSFVLLSEDAREQSWLRRVFSGGAEQRGTPYRIQLREIGEDIEVRVTAPDGSSLSQREAYEVLTLLRSRLA